MRLRYVDDAELAIGPQFRLNRTAKHISLDIYVCDRVGFCFSETNFDIAADDV